MLVKELIQALQGLPEDMPVLVWTESGLEEVQLMPKYDCIEVFRKPGDSNYGTFSYTPRQGDSVINALVIN